MASPTACASVDLSWSASTDNVGVSNYEIYRKRPAGSAAIAAGATVEYDVKSLVSGNGTVSFALVSTSAIAEVSPRGSTRPPRSAGC